MKAVRESPKIVQLPLLMMGIPKEAFLVSMAVGVAAGVLVGNAVSTALLLPMILAGAGYLYLKSRQWNKRNHHFVETVLIRRLKYWSLYGTEDDVKILVAGRKGA